MLFTKSFNKSGLFLSFQPHSEAACYITVTTRTFTGKTHLFAHTHKDIDVTFAFSLEAFILIMHNHGIIKVMVLSFGIRSTVINFGSSLMVLCNV